jgi:hypothetical protein
VFLSLGSPLSRKLATGTDPFGITKDFFFRN